MSLSINSLLKETATSVGDISLCSQTIDVVKIPFASFISSSVEVHRNRAKEKQNEKVGRTFTDAAGNVVIIFPIWHFTSMFTSNSDELFLTYIIIDAF